MAATPAAAAAAVAATPATVAANSSTTATEGDAVAELEAELRVAKTSLAVAFGEKEELAMNVNVFRKHLLTAMSQLTLLQQAMDTKLLRKCVSRSMAALSAKDRAKRAAADRLMARNKAVLMALTHAVAGLPSPVDLERFDLEAEHVAVLDAAAASRAGRVRAAVASFFTHDASAGGEPDSPTAGRDGADGSDEDDDDEAAGGSGEEGGGGGGAHRHRPRGRTMASDDAHPAHAGAAAGGPGGVGAGSAAAAAPLRTLRHVLRKGVVPAARDARRDVLSNPRLLAHVLAFCGAGTVGRAAAVCREWRALPLRADMVLWRQWARSAAVPPMLRAAMWRAHAATGVDVPPHVLSAAAVGTATASVCAAPAQARLAASLPPPAAAWLRAAAVHELPPLACALRSAISAGAAGAPSHVSASVSWGTSLLLRLAAWLAFPALDGTPATTALRPLPPGFATAAAPWEGRVAVLAAYRRRLAATPVTHNVKLARVYGEDSGSEGGSDVEDGVGAGADAGSGANGAAADEGSGRRASNAGGDGEDGAAAQQAALVAWVPRAALRPRTLLKLYSAAATGASVALATAATTATTDAAAAAATATAATDGCAVAPPPVLPTPSAAAAGGSGRRLTGGAGGGGGGSGASGGTRPADQVFPPRPALDHVLRFRAIPPPVRASFRPVDAEEAAVGTRATAPGTEVRSRAASTGGGGGGGGAAGGVGTGSGGNAAGCSAAAAAAAAAPAATVFAAYLAAARANQTAAEAAATVKALASAVRTARAAVNTTMRAIHAAVDAGQPLPEDVSNTFAAGMDAVAAAEGALTAALPPAFVTAAAAHRAVAVADHALVNAVIAARRAHATQLVAAWAARAGGVGRPAAAAPAPAAAADATSGTHAMWVNPATGGVVPSLGVAASPAACTSDPAPAAAALAAAVAAWRERDGAGEEPLEAACAALLPLYADLCPLLPLPPRLAKLLVQVSCMDVDEEEEAALGVASLPVPRVLSEADATPAPAASLRVMFDLGEPASGCPTTVPPLPPAMEERTDDAPPTTGEGDAEWLTSYAAVASVWPTDDGWASVALPALPYASQHTLIDADVRRTFGELDAALKLFGWVRDTSTPAAAASTHGAWVRRPEGSAAAAAAAASAAADGDESGLATLTERDTGRLSNLLYGHHPLATPTAAAGGSSGGSGGAGGGGSSNRLSVVARSGSAASLPSLPRAATGGSVGGGEEPDLELLQNLLPCSFFGVAGSATAGERLTPASVAILRHRLRCVLMAHSAYDRDVGYCQGQNFLTSLMLLGGPPSAAFWSLESLMYNRRFRFAEIFSTGLRRVEASFHVLTALLATHTPRLAAHLSAHCVMPGMYAAGWVMTLFSSLETLPLTYVVPLWDLVLVDGWKALFRAMVALLDGVSSDLLYGDMAVMVQFLHKLPLHRLPPSAAALLRRAVRYKITTRMVNDLERRADAPPSRPAVLADVTAPPAPTAVAGGGGLASPKPQRAASSEAPVAALTSPPPAPVAAPPAQATPAVVTGLAAMMRTEMEAALSSGGGGGGAASDDVSPVARMGTRRGARGGGGALGPYSHDDDDEDEEGEDGEADGEDDDGDSADGNGGAGGRRWVAGGDDGIGGGDEDSMGVHHYLRAGRPPRHRPAVARRMVGAEVAAAVAAAHADMARRVRTGSDAADRRNEERSTPLHDPHSPVAPAPTAAAVSPSNDAFVDYAMTPAFGGLAPAADDGDLDALGDEETLAFGLGFSMPVPPVAAIIRPPSSAGSKSGGSAATTAGFVPVAGASSGGGAGSSGGGGGGSDAGGAARRASLTGGHATAASLSSPPPRHTAGLLSPDTRPLRAVASTAVLTGKMTSSSAGNPMAPAVSAAAVHGDDPLAGGRSPGGAAVAGPGGGGADATAAASGLALASSSSESGNTGATAAAAAGATSSTGKAGGTRLLATGLGTLTSMFRSSSAAAAAKPPPPPPAAAPEE